ncbi:hypothetical protein [Nostoc sp.]
MEQLTSRQSPVPSNRVKIKAIALILTLLRRKRQRAVHPKHHNS